jgi:threonine/homoserine/homoserine lactone efflux protein
MDAQTFLSGLIIGFSVAAPVGPIGILCIRRTLAEGRLHGLVTGLGAATADAFYGCIAAFGLAFISDFLVNQQIWLRVIGGGFLLFLGLRTILAKPRGEAKEERKLGLASSYGSTFLLTLTNPITIISFGAIFATLGLGSIAGDYYSATLLVLSVFLGSASWWLVLSGLVNLLRAKVTQRTQVWINRISGAIILGFGIVALISVVL